MGNEPTVNIASCLAAMAERYPFQAAVRFPHGRDCWGRVSYTHYTFRQLEEESNRLAHGLESVGICKGTRTVLMVPPSLEFFALTFALFKVGATPVMADPGMGVRNLGRCLSEAVPEAFIGIARAQWARRLFGWGKKTIHILISVGPSLGGGYSLTELRGRIQATPQYPTAAFTWDEMAAILFTSGSTGVPKGAVYTHGILLSQVNLLREVFHIEAGEVDLTTFPLFALFAPALGMTAIVPEMDASRPARADPRKIIKAIEDFGVTNLFGSPALLDRVSSYGEERQVSLPSLRRVISAGAPVSSEIVARFAKMLSPGTQVLTPYGATEAMPISSIGSNEIIGETYRLTAQGKGVCVGRPVKGMEVKIIRIGDGPISEWSDEMVVSEGEVGEIAVKGPVVTRSYYNRLEATALAKVRDSNNGGFWHRMGDLGYFDGQGRLWLCGRKSHRVETQEGLLFTLNCEGVFNAHPAVHRTALVGVGKNEQSRIALCVELKPQCRGEDRNKLRKELLVLGATQAHTRDITTILFHPSFPVDVRHNSKIVRETLARWAARKLG